MSNKQQNLGVVRKALDLTSITEMERMLNTFIKICESNPELIIEHHFGAYMRARCENKDIEQDAVPGTQAAYMVQWYAENAQGLVENVLQGTAYQMKCVQCGTNKHPKSTLQPKMCIQCVDDTLKGR